MRRGKLLSRVRHAGAVVCHGGTRRSGQPLSAFNDLCRCAAWVVVGAGLLLLAASFVLVAISDRSHVAIVIAEIGLTAVSLAGVGVFSCHVLRPAPITARRGRWPQ